MQKYPNAAPCHRLDRNTSGLVLYAKNKESLDILLEKFKQKEIDKQYICVVHGIPKKDNQKLEAYLFKDSKKSLVYIYNYPNKKYLYICTKYRIIEKNVKKNISLLNVKLETGRTHQIRAHLAHIGHPIIGDGKYGKNQINKSFGVTQQLLMAYKLKFNFKTSAKHLDYLKNKEYVLDYSDLRKLTSVTSTSASKVCK